MALLREDQQGIEPARRQPGARAGQAIGVFGGREAKLHRPAIGRLRRDLHRQASQTRSVKKLRDNGLRLQPFTRSRLAVSTSWKNGISDGLSCTIKACALA